MVYKIHFKLNYHTYQKSHHIYSQNLNTVSNPLFTKSLFAVCIKHIDLKILLYTNKLFIPLDVRKRDKKHIEVKF